MSDWQKDELRGCSTKGKGTCSCQSNTGCTSKIVKGGTSTVVSYTCSCKTNVKTTAAVYTTTYYCPSHRSTIDYSDPLRKNIRNGAISPRSKTSFLTQNVADKITPAKIQSIQNALTQELSVRSLSSGNWSSFSVTTKIDASTIAKIKSAIDRCVAKDKSTRYCTCDTRGSSSSTYAYNTSSSDSTISWTAMTGASITVGTKFYDDIVNSFQKFTNVLQTKCICDCNYCTCNCNYCSCHSDVRSCSCNQEVVNCSRVLSKPATRTCNCETDASVKVTSTVSCPSKVTCACQCKYATCTCNYGCTCDCNYVCTCHCNYWGNTDKQVCE